MSYGVAFDIGTTTVSGSLLELEKGTKKKRFSCLNNQISYGHDIISRINYALYKTNGPQKLQNSVISSVNFVLNELINNSGIAPKEVTRIVVVCNSVMYHFLLSLPVRSFITPPYSPYKTEKVEVKAIELGINNLPEAKVEILPNIAGFIGSDAIAVILATGLHKSKEHVLAMDIGTNGEIILGSEEEIWVSSTAAGPAFESWHISGGMRAGEGAVESIKDIDGKIHLSVIGSEEPKGISGSGLIDITAILLKRGEIDKTGRLKNKEFIVYDGPEKISLNQTDIREIQLAKAAFSVGTRFLRDKKKSEVSKFFITGTFGSYINKDNARLIGLIPRDIEKDRIEFLSEGALIGAEMFLTKKDLERDITDILTKTKHVSLAEDNTFQKEFAEAMHF